MKKALIVVPDDSKDPPQRWLVKDEEGNIVYMTVRGGSEQDASLWAMKQGGWLTGMVKKMNGSSESQS